MSTPETTPAVPSSVEAIIKQAEAEEKAVIQYNFLPELGEETNSLISGMIADAITKLAYDYIMKTVKSNDMRDVAAARRLFVAKVKNLQDKYAWRGIDTD